MKRLEPYLYGAVIGLLAASASFAVRAQQAPPPADYTITLTGPEWFQVGEALADRPFKISNPILMKINQQVTEIAMKRQKEADDAAAKAKTDAEKPKAEDKPPAAK